MDVRYAELYVDRIASSLQTADPAHAADYVRQADAYKAQLDSLDAWVRAQIETVPVANRKLVTFHDAFPYYAREYGITIVGVAVEAPGQDPSAGYTAQLIAAIKAAATTKPPATVAITRKRRRRSPATSRTSAAPAIVTWTSPTSTCPAAVPGPVPLISAVSGRSAASGTSAAIVPATASTRAAAIRRITSPGWRYRVAGSTRAARRAWGSPAATCIRGGFVMGSKRASWPPVVRRPGRPPAHPSSTGGHPPAR